MRPILVEKIAESIIHDGVGVLPTDTLYGLVGKALSKKTVQRIYTLRRRDPHKPLIILIASFSDLTLFGVSAAGRAMRTLKKVWPGRVTVVLPVASRGLRHLHPKNGTLAFRMPRTPWLQELLKKTGPLVAPSANIAGRPPARTIQEARKYFGDAIEFYYDAGRTRGAPSTIVSFTNGCRVIREGRDGKKIRKMLRLETGI